MFFRIFCWFLFFPALLISSQVEQFTLLVFQDAYHMMPNATEEKGLARMMTLLEKERASTKHSWTLLNGPFLSPLYFSGWDRGEHVVDLLNQMAVDAVLLEDHCLDYGGMELKKRIQESQFSWLSNNLLSRYPLHSPQSHILQVGDMSIGILAVSEIHPHALEENFGLFYCADPLIILQREIRKLRRKKVDLLVLFSNLKRGLDQKIAQTYPEIDAIIGCGQQNPLAWYENTTFILQTGRPHSDLDRIDFFIEKTKEPHQSNVQIYPCYRRILSKGAPLEEALQAQIEKYQTQCLVMYSKEVNHLLYQIKPQERSVALIQAFQKVYPLDGMLFSSESLNEGYLLQDFFVLELKGFELQQILQDASLYVEFDPKLHTSSKELIAQRTYKIGALGRSETLETLRLKKVDLQQIDFAKLVVELQYWMQPAKNG